MVTLSRSSSLNPVYAGMSVCLRRFKVLLIEYKGFELCDKMAEGEPAVS